MRIVSREAMQSDTNFYAWHQRYAVNEKNKNGYREKISQNVFISSHLGGAVLQRHRAQKYAHSSKRQRKAKMELNNKL
ncbi:hypothetical protein HPP92_016001 [Vanilla planifolia]|uniref:Uncharacterized protein n=1 Tax=Vanilla planifolia TaxID=51239 RepID=A0A835QDZ9_VANPL|nr:hypothetical protein HPP92_016001 [Vanilla planifolia]